jgi:hypothetical protein
MLPINVINDILGFAGELRVMKIKMDKNNIKYIFENDKNVSQYLWCKTSSFDTNLYEDIHLKIIDYLTDKKIHMKSLFEKIEKHYKQSYNIDIKYQLFCNIIEMIIDDYNDYYLNDDYYYDGYWYDGKWYNYQEENEFKNF